jgi:hypothetical protein
MKLRNKRIVACSDLHCGSEVGLTPPDWNRKALDRDVGKHNKYVKIREQCWDVFSNIIKTYKPFYGLIVDGDLIEGQNTKSAGVGNIENNREKQASMASDVINFIDPEKVSITYGSDYHVGANGEEWENLIARDVGAKIGVDEWLNVNGVVFNAKHHCGRSTIPHGRATPLIKAALWKMLWKEYKDFPGADIYIRGHVHYFQAWLDSKILTMTLPSLKALGDVHASKYYDDIIDFGVVIFDITENGNYDFKAHTANVKAQIPKIQEF